jgi:hypothetical protein
MGRTTSSKADRPSLPSLQNKVGKSFPEYIAAVTVYQVPHFMISNFRVVTAISLPDISITRTLHNVHLVFLHMVLTTPKNPVASWDTP